MDQIASTYIINKVENLLKTKYYQNIDEFHNKNNNFEQFIINHCKSSTIVAHFNLTLSNDEYNRIIFDLKKKYENTIKHSIYNSESLVNSDTNISKKKVKINMNTINGFVDAMILAFITGAFLGIIFLNLYSKIVSNI